MSTPQVTSTDSVSTPHPDPDAGKYEALRKELGIEQEGGHEQQDESPQVVEKTDADGGHEPEIRTKPETVPYAEHENIQKALKEAREQARTAAAEKAAILQLIEQSRSQRHQEPEKKEPAKLPDVLENPIEHYNARIAKLEEKVEQATQGSQMTAEQLQAYQQQQNFRAVVVRAEQEINDPKNANHKADYWDAVGYLESQRVKELERMYPDHPYVAQQAQQMGFRSVQDLRQAVLNNDRQSIAVQALQMGISPAEFYYSLALDRGYQAKPNGQQRGKDGQFVSTDKAKQQIEMAKKGKAASVSISGGSGSAKAALDMSLSDLSDLAIEDPDAFDKVWEEMRRAGRLG